MQSPRDSHGWLSFMHGSHGCPLRRVLIVETKITGRSASALPCLTWEWQVTSLMVTWSAQDRLGEHHSSCPPWSQKLGCILPHGDASALRAWADLLWQQFRVGGWDAEKSVTGHWSWFGLAANLECQDEQLGTFLFKQYKLFLGWLLCARLYYFCALPLICQVRRAAAMWQSGDLSLGLQSSHPSHKGKEWKAQTWVGGKPQAGCEREKVRRLLTWWGEVMDGWTRTGKWDPSLQRHIKAPTLSIIYQIYPTASLIYGK